MESRQTGAGGRLANGVTNQPFFSYDNDKYLPDNMNNKAGADSKAGGESEERRGERGVCVQLAAD